MSRVAMASSRSSCVGTRTMPDDDTGDSSPSLDIKGVMPLTSLKPSPLTSLPAKNLDPIEGIKSTRNPARHPTYLLEPPSSSSRSQETNTHHITAPTRTSTAPTEHNRRSGPSHCMGDPPKFMHPTCRSGEGSEGGTHTHGSPLAVLFGFTAAKFMPPGFKGSTRDVILFMFSLLLFRLLASSCSTIEANRSCPLVSEFLSVDQLERGREG